MPAVLELRPQTLGPTFQVNHSCPCYKYKLLFTIAVQLQLEGYAQIKGQSMNNYTEEKTGCVMRSGLKFEARTRYTQYNMGITDW